MEEDSSAADAIGATKNAADAETSSVVGAASETTTTIAATNDSKIDDNDKDGDPSTAASSHISNNPSSSSSSMLLSMKDWFQNHASREEADAMTALQLDYRFQGDSFGSMWWIHLQRLGFKHVERHYQLPRTATTNINGNGGGGGDVNAEFDTAATTTVTTITALNSNNNNINPPVPPNKLYAANEIYECLDALAIPQVTSAFDPMPPAATDDRSDNDLKPFPSNQWWRTIRDELIFRNFRKDIEKECRLRAVDKKKTKRIINASTLFLKRKRGSSRNTDVPTTTSTIRRRSTSLSTRPGAAQDAELYMVKKNKNKMSKKLRANRKGKDEDDNAPVEFLSLSDYVEAARQQQQVLDDNDNSNNNKGYFEDKSAVTNAQLEEWRFLVSTNHSLLVYGAGSKRHLLQRFVKNELDQDGDVVELDGYDKTIAMEAMLQLLVDHWLEGKEPSADIYHVHCHDDNDCPSSTPPLYPWNGDTYQVQRAVSIAKRIALVVESTLRPLYLVLHNIDGAALRNATAQEALSVLVSESRTRSGWNAIRLIASVDHVNAPTLLWDTSTRYRFQWVWREAHTQQPYIEEVLESTMAVEISRHNNKKRSKHGKVADSEALFNDEDPATQRDSIFSVLKSLASRHTQALQQLAWLQLESKKNWITYVDLLNQCRLKCVVTHDTQLRSYLGELMDHHIVIRNATEAASATSYRIPYPEDMLDLILDHQPDR